MVTENITALMRTTNLKPGDPIPSEGALALQFGVSRAVIREATRSLGALGLIDVGNGRRARVGTPQAHVLSLIVDHAVFTHHVSIQQVYDVRRSIEMRTVELAALRRSDKEAAAITENAAGMRQNFDDPSRVMESDIAFHQAVAAAGCNPMFELIVRSFADVTRKTWLVGWTSRSTDHQRMSNVKCHEAIALAIQKQDTRGAQVAMAEHFDDSVKALLNAGIT